MLFSIIICIDFRFLGALWILFLVATLVAFVHMDDKFFLPHKWIFLGGLDGN